MPETSRRLRWFDHAANREEGELIRDMLEAEEKR